MQAQNGKRGVSSQSVREENKEILVLVSKCYMLDSCSTFQVTGPVIPSWDYAICARFLEGEQA